MDLNNEMALLKQPSFSLAYLPLRPSTLAALNAAGFHTTQEVYDLVQKDGGGFGNLTRELLKPKNENEMNRLATNAKMLYYEILEAVEIVSKEGSTLIGLNEPPPSSELSFSGRAKTAAELLQLHSRNNDATNNNRCIITFSRALDELLSGGIALGELTELAGSPGSGKTTFCLQLSVNTALPVYCGGVQGRTVYIDTEGSFSPERCHDLATHLIRHVQSGLRRRKQRFNDAVSLEWNVTAQDILSSILVYRVHDVADLNSILHGALPTLLSSSDESPVRLLVVDSIAFPYRAGTSMKEYGSSSAPVIDYVARTQQLTATAAALTYLAAKHQLAVVCVNHMTTSRHLNANENTSCENLEPAIAKTTLIPALGESWAHAVTTRLVLSKPLAPALEKSHQYRICALIKSPRLPTGEANLVIVEAGIRGVEVVVEATKRARLRDSS